ncbi:MAG: BolA family transcriptional regulator [Acetobacteraceae bacterium]|nr:BolA family transcriptional regulator [Acetobacteraceae bacterium]
MKTVPNRADRLNAALTAAFAPSVLHVTDDSAHHAGHAGAAGGGGQTHYSVLVVSAAFQGMSRVARERAVHAAVAGEFGPVENGGMHALAVRPRTPDEHAKQAGTAA